MKRVVAFEHVTLDGVIQPPGRADEDRGDGYEHGGGDAQISGHHQRRRRAWPSAALRLAEAKASPSGVVIATYHQESE
jgi:hypothetical protein